MNLGTLARIAWRQGRLTDAEALTEEALAEFEAANDSAEIADAWTQLAAIRLYQGRREHALPLLARSLQLNQELRSPRGASSRPGGDSTRIDRCGDSRSASGQG